MCIQDKGKNVDVFLPFGVPIAGGDRTSLARLVAVRAFSKPFPPLLCIGPEEPGFCGPNPIEDMTLPPRSEPISP